MADGRVGDAQAVEKGEEVFGGRGHGSSPSPRRPGGERVGVRGFLRVQTGDMGNTTYRRHG
jgi:hypothetical protein